MKTPMPRQGKKVQSEVVEVGQLSQLEKLELLVDELTKESPQEEVIKRYMKLAGLRYTTDPVERIERAFQALEKCRLHKRTDHKHDQSL